MKVDIHALIAEVEGLEGIEAVDERYDAEVGEEEQVNGGREPADACEPILEVESEDEQVEDEDDGHGVDGVEHVAERLEDYEAQHLRGQVDQQQPIQHVLCPQATVQRQH